MADETARAREQAAGPRTPEAWLLLTEIERAGDERVAIVARTATAALDGDVDVERIHRSDAVQLDLRGAGSLRVRGQRADLGLRTERPAADVEYIDLVRQRVVDRQVDHEPILNDVVVDVDDTAVSRSRARVREGPSALRRVEPDVHEGSRTVGVARRERYRHSDGGRGRERCEQRE